MIFVYLCFVSAGWLFDITGDYTAAFITMGAFELLVTLILCLVNLKKRLFDVESKDPTPQSV